MTLYQYKTLDQTDQACVLWNKGVFLSERSKAEHTIAPVSNRRLLCRGVLPPGEKFN